MESTAILHQIAGIKAKLCGIPKTIDNQEALKSLDDIAASLKQDIVRKCILSGQRKQFNAVLAFAKHCAGIGRDAMAGAYMTEINGQSRQVLLDGYTAFAFKKPWEGIPTVKEGVKPIEAQPIFEGADKGSTAELPSLYEMIGAYRAWKSSKGPLDCYLYTKIGIAYANTEYLIRAMIALDITGGEALVTTAVKPIYIKSHCGEALVLPVRIDGNPSRLCWNVKEATP